MSKKDEPLEPFEIVIDEADPPKKKRTWPEELEPIVEQPVDVCFGCAYAPKEGTCEQDCMLKSG